MATYVIDIHYDDFRARSYKILDIEDDILERFNIHNYSRRDAMGVSVELDMGIDADVCFYVSSKARALKITRSARATFAGARIRGVTIRTYRAKG
jgi:hypothetical protein